MEKHLTPDEAWNDFIGNYTGPITNEIAQAKRTAAGMIIKKGKVIRLGAGRVRRLLETYAPGVYSFHAGEPFFTKT